MLLLGASSPPVALHRILADWQTGASAWCVLALLLGAAGAYGLGVRRLRQRERTWWRWRSASFLAGLLVVELAVASGLASYSGSEFSLHVLQLLILIDLAPTLLALGAPISLLIESSPPTLRRSAGRLLSARASAALTHPAIALGLLVASTYCYFLTPLYRLSISHPDLRGLVEVEFFLVGCLYWWLAVGRDRLPHVLSDPGRLLFLGVTIPPGAFLGIDLLNQLRPIAPRHSVADTHIGGALLWGFADLYTLLVLGLVFVRWMRDEDRRQLQGDSARDTIEAAERIVAEAARNLTPPGDAV